MELLRPTPDTRSVGLPERAHSPAVRDRLAQELDVWTREYPVALAAPALVPAEVDATVQAFRDLLADGVSPAPWWPYQPQTWTAPSPCWRPPWPADPTSTWSS
ncbi:hypothetical protein [Blastococcus brunescens]|uniref:Uncharacterized protein n=1 Tax=Blastococcus brunescens TaxID=1564165 RepID=A0ABZ1B1X1_9ACTN|nr:hypothetical protein [Blastococcus sp. BMG 8361]WRL64815.1 hypothetical protein U6N30_03425 [Blastococcus sp. BMG 8361]